MISEKFEKSFQHGYTIQEYDNICKLDPIDYQSGYKRYKNIDCCI